MGPWPKPCGPCFGHSGARPGRLCRFRHVRRRRSASPYAQKTTPHQTFDAVPRDVREDTAWTKRSAECCGTGCFCFSSGSSLGFLELKFKNPRMGLAAHLEGVMNGTFLLALGAVWLEVRLSPPWKTAAYWGALYGTYANWAMTTLAAVLGTGALSPITAAGHGAPAWQESLVTAGLHQRRPGDGGHLRPHSLGPAAKGAGLGGARQRRPPQWEGVDAVKRPREYAPSNPCASWAP